MWTVLKFDKKNLALLKEDLTGKLGKEFKASFLSDSNFDKSLNLPSFFKIKLNIFQSSSASPMG